MHFAEADKDVCRKLRGISLKFIMGLYLSFFETSDLFHLSRPSVLILYTTINYFVFINGILNQKYCFQLMASIVGRNIILIKKENKPKGLPGSCSITKGTQMI